MEVWNMIRDVLDIGLGASAIGLYLKLLPRVERLEKRAGLTIAKA